MLCMLLATVKLQLPEDKRKIELLYEKYNRLMYVVAYNILNHQQDAEDALLSSWEKVIKNLDKINEIDCQETKSFLVIIVERTSIDLYRRNKKRGEVQLLLENYEASPYFITHDIRLQNTELQETFRSIPKTYSDVLILYYINRLSTKEISKIFEMKEDAIMKRLSRGRQLIRKGILNG